MNDAVETSQQSRETENHESNGGAEKNHPESPNRKPNGQQEDRSNKQGRNNPPGFDWVTARSACSLPKVYKELRLEIEGDVKTRNGLRPGYAPYTFSVTDKDSDFMVVLVGKDLRKSVTFSLGEHAILVRDDEGKQMIEVTLSFTDYGQCVLNASGKNCELWQVRRMALEDLMFPRQ